MEILKRTGRRISTVVAMVAVLAMAAVPAFADPDPTEEVSGVVEDGFQSIQDLMTGTLAVSLFLLVTIVLAVVIGVRWLARGAKQS